MSSKLSNTLQSLATRVPVIVLHTVDGRFHALRESLVGAVCVSTYEIRITWPKEPNVFWKACADFHFPFFWFHRDCLTYHKIILCFVPSYWSVQGRA